MVLGVALDPLHPGIHGMWPWPRQLQHPQQDLVQGCFRGAGGRVETRCEAAGEASAEVKGMRSREESDFLPAPQAADSSVYTSLPECALQGGVLRDEVGKGVNPKQL